MNTENQFYSYKDIDVSYWDQVKPLLEELHADHCERWPEKYAEPVSLDKERYVNSFGAGCFIGKRMIGLCWGDIKSSGRAQPIAWVEDFIVSKDCRDLGVGSMLFAWFREMAKQRGAKGLELCTECANVDALRFYDREKLKPTCHVLRQTFT